MALNINGNIISSTDITSVGVFKTEVNRDGLICYLDAADKNSYPGSGTVWYDLTGNGNNFNLTNTTFSSETIVFNGSSSYARSVNTINLTSYSTVLVEVYVKAANTNAGFIFEHTADWNSNTGGFGMLINHNGSVATPNTHHTNHNTEAAFNYVYTIGTNWNDHVNAYSKIAAIGRKTYMNAAYLSGTTTVAGSFANDYMYLGARGSTTLFFNGSLSSLKIYGSMLNSYEIAENFQATRGRFGL